MILWVECKVKPSAVVCVIRMECCFYCIHVRHQDGIPATRQCRSAETIPSDAIHLTSHQRMAVPTSGKGAHLNVCKESPANE